MPKIIPHLRSRLINEARKQAEEKGYGAVTVRGVAEAVNIGVGTLYNYFPSKEMMIAQFMLEDWLTALAALREKITQHTTAEETVLAIHTALQTYIDNHRFVLNDPAAAKTFYTIPREKHLLMASQLSDLLLPHCLAAGYEDPSFIALFLSKNLLTFSGTGRPFADLAPIFARILKK